MDLQEFIINYRDAFGSKAQLPLLFGSHAWEKMKQRLEE